MAILEVTAGKIISDRYEIISLLGEGGMQKVYCAHDRVFDKQVALKCPKTESASKRFTRSAQMSARVTHANVAKTLDYLTESDSDFLVEELVPGTDLQKRFKSEFRYFDPHLVAHIIYHIAKGVAASHHVGVVHRDLKPSNIMVSSDPTLSMVKITDFGIAKMAAESIDEAINEGEESMTGSSTVVGALPYMAPELFIGDSNTASFPVDIWAIGAMLYHFLVGELPFGKGFKAIRRIERGELPVNRAGVGERPQFTIIVNELWLIMESCLQMAPEKRPPADQLVTLLSAVCYSTAERKVGSIYNFGISPKMKTSGFIHTPEGEDYFFHEDSYYKGEPKNGQKVNFAFFPGHPRGRAFPVLAIR